MLISRSAIKPPTMTIAKGRWESEPMACDSTAGSKPSVATSMVIMMGRSLRTAPSRAQLTRIFDFPIDVVATRQLNPCVYFLDCFFDRAAEVAPAHAVLDRDIPLVSFTVDFRTAVLFCNFAELCEGNAFARRSQQSNVLNGFPRGAVLRKIT